MTIYVKQKLLGTSWNWKCDLAKPLKLAHVDHFRRKARKKILKKWCKLRIHNLDWNLALLPSSPGDKGASGPRARYVQNWKVRFQPDIATAFCAAIEITFVKWLSNYCGDCSTVSPPLFDPCCMCFKCPSVFYGVFRKFAWVLSCSSMQQCPVSRKTRVFQENSRPQCRNGWKAWWKHIMVMESTNQIRWRSQPVLSLDWIKATKSQDAKGCRCSMAATWHRRTELPATRATRQPGWYAKRLVQRQRRQRS